jgi:transposase
MDVIYQRCCGLDIHKKTVVACVVVPGPTGEATKATKTFGTMTAELLTLSDWLTAQGVTHVAMESTGVYWKPIWNILEGNFTLLLANARHIKAVPGRKSDVRDCEWIADLLRHGLLRGSFVPDRDQRELRELTRYRTSLVRERSAEVNRLEKVLEGANIKLAAVASDLTGKSARAMLAELVAGTTDAAVLADLALGKMRGKIPQLEQALTGRVGAHQRYLMARQLAHIDFLDQAVAELDDEITRRMASVQAMIEVLDAIPGVGRQTAQAIIAEVERSQSVPDGPAPGVVGGDGPRAGRERGQTPQQSDSSRRPLAPVDPR